MGPHGPLTTNSTPIPLPRGVFLFPFCIFLGNKFYSFFRSALLGLFVLLNMLVAKWVPTPCYNHAYSGGHPLLGISGERLAKVS